jgi:hypothetical protein
LFNVHSHWAEGDEYAVAEEDREKPLIYDPATKLLMYGEHRFKKPKTAKEMLVSVLVPSKINEFTRRCTADEAKDCGAYQFKNDSNGNHYHFVGFVSDGDSQWDGLYYTENFTASSTLATQKNNSYDAVNLQNNTTYGGDRSVAWSEGVKGYGIGERINMSVTTLAMYGNASVVLTSLMIVNGYAKNQTVWQNNSRVKTLRLYVDGKHWCDLHLKDIMKPQIFNFPEHLVIQPHKLGKKVTKNKDWLSYREPASFAYQTDLSFEIIEVYPGDKYEDTCITGIALNVYSGIY